MYIRQQAREASMLPIENGSIAIGASRIYDELTAGSPNIFIVRRQRPALSLSCPAYLAARSLPQMILPVDPSRSGARIRRRGVSPTELTKACLARIKRYDIKINALSP